MQIQYFEKKIKQINPRLSIRRNKADIAGVYIGEDYLGIAVPPEFIFDNYNHKHTDKYGNAFRNIEHTIDIIKAKLNKYESTK